MPRDYGKVSTTLWNSRKFQSLETPEARLVYLYLHTCPHVNSVGCFVLPDRYGAADTGLELKTYQTALIALSKALLIGHDENESVIRIIDFLKHDPFTNKNHAIGSIRIAEKLPDCEQKFLVFKDIACQPFQSIASSDDSPIEGVSNPLNPEPTTPNGVGVSSKQMTTFQLIETEKKEGSAREADLVAEFDKVWEHYPRKVSKGDSRKAWVKARKRVDRDVLAKSLWAHIKVWKNGTPIDKIPHMSRWLNDERWDDDPAHAANRRGTSDDQLNALQANPMDDLKTLYATPPEIEQ